MNQWKYEGHTFQELFNDAGGDCAFHAAVQVAKRLHLNTSQWTISALRRQAVEEAIEEGKETKDNDLSNIEQHKERYSCDGKAVSPHVLFAALRILGVDEAQYQLVQPVSVSTDKEKAFNTEELMNQGNRDIVVDVTRQLIVFRHAHFAVLDMVNEEANGKENDDGTGRKNGSRSSVTSRSGFFSNRNDGNGRNDADGDSKGSGDGGMAVDDGGNGSVGGGNGDGDRSNGVGGGGKAAGGDGNDDVGDSCNGSDDRGDDPAHGGDDAGQGGSGSGEGLDPHVWPRYTAQMTQAAMYAMRQCIRQEKGVTAGYEAAKMELRCQDDHELGCCLLDDDVFAPNQNLGALLDDALLARDLNHAMSVIAYSVRSGRKEWFHDCLHRTKQKFGVNVLVNELRAVDINGASILFQAASCNSKTTCFREVCNALSTVLTRYGLIEQVVAIDHVNRNIIMHAARGGHAFVFKQVWGMYQRYMPNWREIPWFAADATGRTVLHHAAEAGSLSVLKEVINLLESVAVDKTVENKPNKDDMNSPDSNGRTPIMHLLRSRYKPFNFRSELPEKFDILHRYAGGRWREARPVLRLETKDKKVTAATELMHAARGGIESWTLVLETIRSELENDIITFDDVLNVGFSEPPVEGGGPQDCSTTELVMDLSRKDWGWGMLLASAVKGGHGDVMKAVTNAIKFETFKLPIADEVADAVGEQQQKERLRGAVRAITKSGRSLYTLAVLSGKVSAVKMVHEFVRRHVDGGLFESGEVWDFVRGIGSKIRPISCAASASMEVREQNGTTDHGVAMLKTMLSCLEQAAKEAYGADEAAKAKQAVLDHMSKRKGTDDKEDVKYTPLCIAAFRSNWALFRRIYDEFERRDGGRWPRDLVWEIFPIDPPETLTGSEHQEMHEATEHTYASTESQQTRVSPVMWKDMVEAYQRSSAEKKNGRPSAGENGPATFPSRRSAFQKYSERAVDLATTKYRAFDYLRDLVREGFPLHEEHMPKLLRYVEEAEENITDIVMYAVGNASNPLVMSASVSNFLKHAEDRSPSHAGLRRLQRNVDDLIKELLQQLPHTIRGMGATLLRPFPRQDGRARRKTQQEQDMLAFLAGFIVAEWILVPHVLVDQLTLGQRYLRHDGPKFLDPLKHALQRGSEALKFINMPLVKDYVDVKFSCTLPHWASTSPFRSPINPGFYKYHRFKGTKSEDTKSEEIDVDERWYARLLRYVQGWDVLQTNPDLEEACEIAVALAEAKKHVAEAAIEALPPKAASEEPEKVAVRALEEASRNLEAAKIKLRKAQGYKINPSLVPHTTILPGLQFWLAGLVGKPGTFYDVPAVRFAFELLSYLVMVGLFWPAVLLEDMKHIPLDESIFYVFVAGIMWREFLEIGDCMPGRESHDHPRRRDTDPRAQPPRPRRTEAGPEPTAVGILASAARRYISRDRWNVLDVMTVAIVLLAFIFRLLGMFNVQGPTTPDDAFFLAQFFLASSAPLLFARFLLLLQIDATLGPMTHVIWKMLSSTMRFSVFIAIFMSAYALAFHALFFECSEGTEIGDSFGTFAMSLLFVFQAPFGVFDFAIFDTVDSDCPHLPAPVRGRAHDVGIVLLVGYIVVMALILFNLLIAILSTTHREVSRKSEQEFHLARTRLVLQSAEAVARCRIPPPLNLVHPILGVLADTTQALWCVFRGRFSTQEAEPVTSTFGWATFVGSLHRVFFALFMGLPALLLLVLLWTLSVPLMAANLVVWFKKLVSQKHSPRSSGSSNSPNAGPQPSASRPKRGVRTLISFFVALAEWFLACFPATFLCFWFSVGSVVLYIRGWYGVVVEWAVWRKVLERLYSCEEEKEFPNSMPGQECGQDWCHAWRCVSKTRSFNIQDEQGSVNFNVGPLLQITTGLDLQHLSLIVKQRGKRARTNKETAEILGKEASGHVFP